MDDTLAMDTVSSSTLRIKYAWRGASTPLQVLSTMKKGSLEKEKHLFFGSNGDGPTMPVASPELLIESRGPCNQRGCLP